MAITMSDKPYYAVRQKSPADGCRPTGEAREKHMAQWKAIKAHGRRDFKTKAQANKQVTALVKAGIATKAELEVVEYWSMGFAL